MDGGLGLNGLGQELIIKILGRLVLVWSCSAPQNRQGSMSGLIHQVWFSVKVYRAYLPGRDRTAA